MRKEKVLILRLSEELNDALRQVAQDNNESVSNLVRRTIIKSLKIKIKVDKHE